MGHPRRRLSQCSVGGSNQSDGVSSVDERDGRRSHRVTFAVLAVGLCAYSLLQSMVIPVLPALQAELGTTQSDVTWVLTANLLAASVATPIVGRLGDMFGKRRMFVSVLALLSVGCLLSALAGALPLMLVGRVLQGIGGGVIPLGYSILRDEFPDAGVAGAIGALSSLIAVGSSTGLVIAGPIDSALGLDWLFWLPMVVGALASIVAYLVIPESRVRTPGRVNWPAAVLLSGWLVCVLLGVSRANTWGWGSPLVLGLLTGGVVLLALWIVVETRSAVPLIDMRMMRLRAVWTANVIGFLVGLTIFAAFAFIPQFLQTPPEAGYGFGATISQVGLTLCRRPPPGSSPVCSPGGWDGGSARGTSSSAARSSPHSRTGSSPWPTTSTGSCRSPSCCWASEPGRPRPPWPTSS